MIGNNIKLSISHITKQNSKADHSILGLLGLGLQQIFEPYLPDIFAASSSVLHLVNL